MYPPFECHPSLIYSWSFTETGNMLIMTYAHARASGDGSLISRYVRTGLLFGPVKD